MLLSSRLGQLFYIRFLFCAVLARKLVVPHPDNLWKYGLIPQAIANGLSSILVLFFLLSNLHGDLLDIGLVAGVSALALIPSMSRRLITRFLVILVLSSVESALTCTSRSVSDSSQESDG